MKNNKNISYLAILCVLSILGCQQISPPANSLPQSVEIHHKSINQTPPMGWNPWNAFRTEVNEAKILAIADVMKKEGLQAAGYQYINMDDGWWLKRDSNGQHIIRTSMFPSAQMPDGSTSFLPYTNTLHEMGYKAGIYTDIGRNVCSQAWDSKSPNLPVGNIQEREVGLMGHVEADLNRFFNEWKFDYIKVDACGLADYSEDKKHVKSGQYAAYPPLIIRGQAQQSNIVKIESLYADLDKALDNLNLNQQFVSICAWGEGRVSDWAYQYGQSWRTSADIRSNWASMWHNFDSASGRALFSSPGQWNDPDMLEIGNKDFDADHLIAAQTHFSLWAMLNAPLILSSDLTKWTPELIELVKNPKVIALNQDKAGHQAVIFQQSEDSIILVKTLANKQKAILFANRSDKHISLSLNLADLNFKANSQANLTNLWSGKSDRVDVTNFKQALAPKASALYVIDAEPQVLNRTYLADIPGAIEVRSKDYLNPYLDLNNQYIPARVNQTLTGEVLTKQGKKLLNTLVTSNKTELVLDLNSKYKIFSTQLSELTSLNPSYQVKIWADDKLVYRQAHKTDSEIKLDIQGKNKLRLVVESDENDLAQWLWQHAYLDK
ncbi:NPCBM/NEW2 domain-containing protein [Catenovulum sp. 2E275]|uniref:NPCBM/NEW2 domain-containing protein n=1 Tax=Catenovulum sp. 2E275 TaxID=2980497 RepID=UPI0021D17E85|nr:NPCBM/NEW2 domain-containing protein [Catenovulum sp. 2E275]MCU4675244.1 NPCBM/NEW2 domain-containing protein [Catenovulum sp. 2E275]